MIKTTELCLVCGDRHGIGMQCPNAVAMAIIGRANTRYDIGFSFQPVVSREEVMARLVEAQAKVIAAAPVLLSYEFKFEEIHGPRK